MNETEKQKVITDVDRVWQRHRSSADIYLERAVENIMTTGLPASIENANVPEAIEYTSLSANFAYALACQGKNVAVISTNKDCNDWLKQSDDPSSNKIILFEETIPIDKPGFVLSPLGGWRIVLLDDVMMRFNKEEDLIKLLKAIRPTLHTEASVIVRLPILFERDTTEELDGVVLTEIITKERPKIFNRVMTLRTDGEGYRSEEKLFNWDSGSVHYCAKEAGFKTTHEFGLEPQMFCSYVKSN